MTRSPVLHVARWEFRRYFKLRQQLVGVVLTLLTGLAAFGVYRVATRDHPVELAVAGDALPVGSYVPDRFRLVPLPPGEEAARLEAVRTGELDGVLRLLSEDRVELVVRRHADWIAELRTALTAARRDEMLSRAAISPTALESILASPELRVIDRGGGHRGSAGERLALILTLAVMLITIFIGLGYIFSSITGEKQIRVAEQVVSAIPAQTWIDGKILGLLAMSLASVATTVLGFGVLALALGRWGVPVPLDDATIDPATTALVVLFGLLGLLFWFSFLAAIAAMIDDPNNSARGPLLFLPLLATALGFLALENPDSALVRTLALLPPTAPAAMPARVLLTPVSPLEIGLSLGLLAAAVLFLRIAAGRIFRLGMLMYGKEPSWSEVRRWILTP